MTIPTTTPADAAPAVSVIPKKKRDEALATGNYAHYTMEERAAHITKVCRDLNLNEDTNPLVFIKLPDGRVIPYATRACADQLRKSHNITLEIVSRDVKDDVLTIHVKARMPDGRSDEDLGTVWFGPDVKGVTRANKELHAVTKAKRRVTLSICGLGWLDETEVEDIPGAKPITPDAKPAPAPEPPPANGNAPPRRTPPPVGANVITPPPDKPPHDPVTGEVFEEAPVEVTAPPSSAKGQLQRMERLNALKIQARSACRNGTIDGFWPTLTTEEYQRMMSDTAFVDELKKLKLEHLGKPVPPQAQPKTEAADGSSPKRRLKQAIEEDIPIPPRYVPADSPDSGEPSFLDLVPDDDP